MMRSLLLAGLGISTCLYTHAQTADSTLPIQRKISPTQQAARQLNNLQKKLHLTQDQVLQLQVILIDRDVAMDSLRNNTSGDRRTDNHARRAILQQADRQIDTLLTDDQRPLYQQWKEEQRQKAALKKSIPLQP